MPDKTSTATSPKLSRLAPASADQRMGDLLARNYRYRSWEDVYRDTWTWDRVVKVTHHRVNCNNACSYDAYVKDGVVWREEQNSTYEHAFADVPDFNPRGCTMGCVYSAQMYDPSRLKYPMKQTGKRGSGKWQRISWDQAYTEIADKLLDIIEKYGPETIMYECGPNSDFGIGTPMETQLFAAGLGGTTIDVQSAVGDLLNGLIQTWGLYMSEGTSDDWFNSDYILMWIGNLNYTRPADAHFIWEARYRGAKVVSICPDYSASTINADRWLNPRYGTDAALALAMINVIIEEGLYKADYMKEQTDLPFLIRADNGRYLRESDVVEGGAEGNFYFWDAASGKKMKAPGTWDSNDQSIELPEGVDPQLSGSHTVRLKDGSSVRVRTVFDLLRKRAARYSPERTAKITGVAAKNVRLVAREFATAKAAMIYSSWGGCKHYHSDLFQRGMAYLCALTGNSGGKPGTGIRVGALWQAPFAALTMMSPNGVRLNTEPMPDMPIDRIPMQAMAKATLAQAGRGPVTTLIPWLYTHDPRWREIAVRDQYNDPALKRPVREYMDELIERHWQPVTPEPGKQPRAYYVSGTNVLRRWPNPGVIKDSLWAKLDLVVTTDTKMSTTALESDYVLPACGWYEKPGIKYTMSYIPYVVAGDRAVPPLHESRHEWDIVLGLARAIQERAKARGIGAYTDPFGRPHDPSRLYEDLTGGGVYPEGEAGERLALSFIFQNSPILRANNLGEDAWEKVAEAGMVKLEAMKPSTLFGGVYSDFTTERPMYPFDWFIVRKFPWPTLTGRQQFYIDHEWFMEVGEELLTHKEPLPAGGNYPIRLSGGHTRWSMHSVFRINEPLLRLQRGEPVAYISQADAKARRIKDHDRIRIYNDVGSFILRAKVAPGVQKGMTLVYHAWESFQFEGRSTQNDVVANPPKPTNMVGNYGHLHHRMGSYTMNHMPKEVAVEIERLGP